MNTRISILAKFGLWVGLAMATLPLGAQQPTPREKHQTTQEATQTSNMADTIGNLDLPLPPEMAMKPMAKADTVGKKPKRDWSTWRPNPKRALWLALVLPGAGQIYNRKFWKLPIIYGGFVGCAYAMRWNNMMYSDYSQAYLDIMDNDPLTQSYNQFLHLGNTITESNKTQWQEIFRKRKDRYRRWRDLSFFTMLGVYALSVVDAYVDASLSEFDISPDLSLHVAPAVINNRDLAGNPFGGSGIGLQCSLSF